MRATGHGISAGIGKFGAFIGVFLFPVLQTSLGLRGTLLLTAGVSVLGFALTRVLPETSGVSLEEIAKPSVIGLEVAAEPTGIHQEGVATGTRHRHPIAGRGRSGYPSRCAWRMKQQRADDPHLLDVALRDSALTLRRARCYLGLRLPSRRSGRGTPRPARRSPRWCGPLAEPGTPDTASSPTPAPAVEATRAPVRGTDFQVQDVTGASPSPGRSGSMNSARSTSWPIRFRTKRSPAKVSSISPALRGSLRPPARRRTRRRDRAPSRRRQS